MKQYIPFLVGFFIFTGCEDVIEVDAPSEPSRLSVDALIRIDENQSVTTAVVNVSLTSSFFGTTEAAELDLITISNSDYDPMGPSDQNFIELIEIGPGRYEASKNTSFFTDGELELSITYDDISYRASTRYVPTASIDRLEQGKSKLFTGDETEVLVAFTDDPNRSDYYLFDFDFNEYLVTEDEFYQGQTFEFSYFYNDEIETGREIEISILGVDQPFYNYMNQLIVQAGGDQGPFQTPSATVRGNIIQVADGDSSEDSDINNRTNFALGYFAVCQTFSESIEIE